MSLTRDFKETVAARVQKDPAFAQALLDEAITPQHPESFLKAPIYCYASSGACVPVVNHPPPIFKIPAPKTQPLSGWDFFCLPPLRCAVASLA